MKILYVTNSDDKYGCAQCLMELLEQMRTVADVEVEVLTPGRNKLNEWCDAHGIKNYAVRYYDQMYSKHDPGIIFLVKYMSYVPRYYISNRFAIREIERTIDIDSFDVIHTNTVVIDIGAQLAKRHGIKHVWHLREYGKEDMNFIPYRIGCYKRMNAYESKFITVSDGVKKAWIMKGISAEKITRIYDGVKADSFSGKSHLFDHEKIKIAFCGSICPFKGQKQLIEAFNMMPPEKRKLFDVDIWGSGKAEYVDSLKESVVKYDLTDVISFKGYADDLHKRLSEYDVGMNCSASEAFGRTTVEYMLAGLLVMASNAGANPELLQDGKLGILYDKDNHTDLCNKLLWLVDNRNEVTSMPEKAKTYAKKMFSIQNNGERFYEYYKALC